mgnify:CR=1 FL=1
MDGVGLGQHGGLHIGRRTQAEGVAIALRPHQCIGQRFGGQIQPFLLTRVGRQREAKVAEHVRRARIGNVDSNVVVAVGADDDDVFLADGRSW